MGDLPFSTVGRQCSFTFWNFVPLALSFIPDTGTSLLAVGYFIIQNTQNQQCGEGPGDMGPPRYIIYDDLEIRAKTG